MVHTEALSHRLHRLAPPVGQQPTHVQLTLAPLVRPPHAAEHPPGELQQPRTHLGDLLRCHPKITPGRSPEPVERHT
jgi:hypothetical protein